MSSANIRSVAADSNVLLSAVAGKAARRVFENSELIVVTTEQNIAEVREYAPLFAERYGLPLDVLLETLELLPVYIYAEREYARNLPAASPACWSRRRRCCPCSSCVEARGTDLVQRPRLRALSEWCLYNRNASEGIGEITPAPANYCQKLSSRRS